MVHLTYTCVCLSPAFDTTWVWTSALWRWVGPRMARATTGPSIPPASTTSRRATTGGDRRVDAHAPTEMTSAWTSAHCHSPTAATWDTCRWRHIRPPLATTRTRRPTWSQLRRCTISTPPEIRWVRPFPACTTRPTCRRHRLTPTNSKWRCHLLSRQELILRLRWHCLHHPCHQQAWQYQTPSCNHLCLWWRHIRQCPRRLRRRRTFRVQWTDASVTVRTQWRTAGRYSDTCRCWLVLLNLLLLQRCGCNIWYSNEQHNVLYTVIFFLEKV